MSALPGPISYVATVIGDRSPFRWEVNRVQNGKRTTLAEKGEADTREEALGAATEAARGAESVRAHAAAREDVSVLEVRPPAAQASVSDLEAIPVQPKVTPQFPWAELHPFMD